MNDTPADEVDFGFRRVAREEKQGLVRGVFERVAGRYDLMNDLMSMGLHRLWKADMIAALRPKPGMRLLDVAGGTGDIAFRFLDRAGEGASAVVCDINSAMVSVGRDRAIDATRLEGIDWVVGNAEALPLPDRSVDAYTIAFGIRNVTDIQQALKEARRVLKPGGHFLCLEFGHVALPGLDKLYDLYSFQVLPRLGAAVAGDEESYRYLAESIRRFPKKDAFAGMMTTAGLTQVRQRDLSGGIVNLHSGWRV